MIEPLIDECPACGVALDVRGYRLDSSMNVPTNGLFYDINTSTQKDSYGHAIAHIVDYTCVRCGAGWQHGQYGE